MVVCFVNIGGERWLFVLLNHKPSEVRGGCLFC